MRNSAFNAKMLHGLPRQSDRSVAVKSERTHCDSLRYTTKIKLSRNNKNHDRSYRSTRCFD